jgi:outer membrane protein insertion porin family
LRGFVWIAFAGCLALGFLLPRWAVAQEDAGTFVPIEELSSLSIPDDELSLDPSVLGLPIVKVEVKSRGTRWRAPIEVKSVTFGELLTPSVARRAMKELADTGGFTDLAAFAEKGTGGVVLRVLGTPSRRVVSIRVDGGILERSETISATKIAVFDRVSDGDLELLPSRVRELYAKRGYAKAVVSVQAVELDDPLDVLIVITVEPGVAREVTQRIFVIEPRFDAHVGDLKFDYEVSAGDRADESALEDADRDLAQKLREAAFIRAKVSHRVLARGAFTYLYVYVDSGPKIEPIFEGNWAFEGSELSDVLQLDEGQGSSLADFAEKLRRHYVAHGFLDATVGSEVRPSDDEGIEYVAFSIVERERAVVTRRVFACLPTELDPDDLGAEIDRVLEEELPSRGLISVPAPATIDQTLSSNVPGGVRVAPLELYPATTYTPEAYAAAMKRVKDVLLGKGYLNASVGPLTVIRARCKTTSADGACVEEPVAVPRAACATSREGLPIDEPPLPRDVTCVPSSSKGVRCSPRLTLHIPLHVGPVTKLWDVAFVGVRHTTAVELAAKAQLDVGDPLDLTALDEARARLSTFYADRGYAYAAVETSVDLSPDRSRAKVTFRIEEREVVTIEGIEIEGARQTDHELIRRRLALAKGDRYSQEKLRLSEERLATLGPFSSVSVTLSEPEVVARQKIVIVRVQEYSTQYLEPRGGFSTGEGLRFALEYGHRNIASLGISLTLRIQLSYLFDFIILDSAVAENLGPLSASERLERRNSARLVFPDIGLGPTVSFGIEALDVLDNQRDFSLSRGAIVPSVTWRPLRELATTLSAAVELNDENIFTGQSINEVIAGNRNLEQLLRFPDGTTFAIAQRLAVGWDRRDVPLNATRGTLSSIDVEHVNAFPADSEDPDTDPLVSHFLRMSGRFTGYIRITDGGAAIAIGLAAGGNVQLQSESKTYPDRLFFLGGSDSLRSFLVASLVPEDVAQQILKGELEITDVAIRGGDFWWNPRVEFRLPLTDLFGIGLFAEAGNLWVDPSAGFNPFALRYGLGGGVRFSTPVGPIAIDGGLNPDRRPWEDVGAVHFAVGLL